MVDSFAIHFLAPRSAVQTHPTDALHQRSESPRQALRKRWAHELTFSAERPAATSLRARKWTLWALATRSIKTTSELRPEFHRPPAPIPSISEPIQRPGAFHNPAGASEWVSDLRRLIEAARLRGAPGAQEEDELHNPAHLVARGEEFEGVGHQAAFCSPPARSSRAKGRSSSSGTAQPG